MQKGLIIGTNWVDWLSQARSLAHARRRPVVVRGRGFSEHANDRQEDSYAEQQRRAPLVTLSSGRHFLFQVTIPGYKRPPLITSTIVATRRTAKSTPSTRLVVFSGEHQLPESAVTEFLPCSSDASRRLSAHCAAASPAAIIRSMAAAPGR